MDFITNLWNVVLAYWSAYPLLRLAGYLVVGYLLYRLLSRVVRKQVALNRKSKVVVEKTAVQDDLTKTPVVQSNLSPSTADISAQPLVTSSVVTTLNESSSQRVYTPSADLSGERHLHTFSVFDNDVSRDLPRLEPGDLPVSDRSDLAFGSLTPLLASLLPESTERKRLTKKELQHAGYYEPHAYQNLAATRYLAVVIPILASLLLLVFGPPEAEFIAIGAMLALPLLGWSIPRLILRGQGKTRMSEIEQGFPDMLDMLNMCVSQGLPILPSLKRVGDELDDIYPALAQELRITYEQAELGNTQQALENFRDRVDLPDVNSFTSLLSQTERMGTSISNALTQYSDNMRDTLKQRADAKANTATFKLLFPTVLCLVPAVYLFLLGPAIVDLSDFFYGGGAEVLSNNTQAASTVLQEN